MHRFILIVSVLVPGCERWSTCDDLADWSIAVTRAGTTDEGADAHTTRGDDGTLFIAISDPFTAVEFGGQHLEGPHLARVAPDGVIEKLAAIPAEGGVYASVVRADTAGNVVILWGGGSTSTVTGYDAGLRKRWSRPARPGFMQPFEVAPTGHVVFVDTNATSPTSTTSLIYLEPDGSLRWELPTTEVWPSKLQIADNGDVFAFHSDSGGAHRIRYAASDGSVVEQIEIEVIPELTRPDGSFFHVGYTSSGPAGAAIAAYDANGVELWSHERALRGLGNPILSSTGALLVQTSYEDLSGPSYKLLVLDAATGAEQSEAPMCSHQRIFAADATHYFGLGLIGSPSLGLAGFALR